MPVAAKRIIDAWILVPSRRQNNSIQVSGSGQFRARLVNTVPIVYG